jgi:tryptophan synthase alpha chain
MGITGTKSVPEAAVRKAVGRLRRHTDLPIAVGFGIKTSAEARAIAAAADAAVVGSAIVNRIAAKLDANGKAKPGLVEDVLGFVRELADGAHGA